MHISNIEDAGDVPFEVNGQADGYLIPRESAETLSLRIASVLQRCVHILRRHLLLVLAERIETAQRDIRVCDAMLSCR